jgi:dCTP deaminase
MILTSSEIEAQLKVGGLTIDPFRRDQLNPNSYNYRLGRFLLRLAVSDASGIAVAGRHDLSQSKFLLRPGNVYLGHTFEKVGSRQFVTLLSGRSSMGRLGLYLNFSADLGHTGAIHSWTLELQVIQPLWVTYGMVIGQATFWDSLGELSPYDGVLSRTDLPVGSDYAALRRT